MSLAGRVIGSIPPEAWKAIFFGGASIGFLMAVAGIQKIREARRQEQLRSRAQ